MKFSVKGTVKPPRGTPGANGTFAVDLQVDVPERIARLVELAGAVIAGQKVPDSVRQSFALAIERRDEGKRTTIETLTPPGWQR